MTINYLGDLREPSQSGSYHGVPYVLHFNFLLVLILFFLYRNTSFFHYVSSKYNFESEELKFLFLCLECSDTC